MAARAALILALLGVGAVFAVWRYLVRPHTPLGDSFLASGVPPVAILMIGLAVVLGFAIYGFWRSLRTAERFRIGAAGLEVTSPLFGEYVVHWENVTNAALTPGGSLGLALADRADLLRAHRGTDSQRELLRTTEPFGEWDLLFHRAELGHRPEAVLAWLQPYLKAAEPRDG